MEDELKCSYCNNFYCNPVLLPCSHSLCYACALDLQQKFNSSNSFIYNSSTNHQLDENFNTIRSSKTNEKKNVLIESTLKLNRLLANKSNNSQESNSEQLDNNNVNIPSPSSIGSSQSISSSSSINIDQINLNEHFGTSIVSDLDKLSVFSEADSGVNIASICNLNINSSSPKNQSLSSSSSSSSSSSNSCTVTSSSASSTSSGYSRPCSYLSNSSLTTNATNSTTTTNQNHSTSFYGSMASMAIKQQSSNKASTPQLPLIPAPVFSSATPLYTIYLPCPHCKQMIYMDETGIDSLVKNTCLENIIERYMESKKFIIKCQLCPPNNLVHDENSGDNGKDAVDGKCNEKEAVVMCEQCEIYYCEQCREACHPMRGPLQKHTLLPSKVGRDLLRRKNKMKESKCMDHPSEQVTLYCMVCKSACCNLCVTDSVHLNHEMQQINHYSKSQKTELSQILQGLSEKAKSATEFVTQLKSLPEIIEGNSIQIKSIILSEIDELIRLLELKKNELTEFIDIEKANKVKSIKEQINGFSTKIQKTTGLLQFCVETLKEPDPTSFLNISEHLIKKMSDIDCKFPADTSLHPKCDIDFDFVLNSDVLYMEIKKLNCKQIKMPNTPIFVAENCITDLNQTIVLSWSQKTLTKKNNAQGYILEIDDGTAESPFKEVYCGPNSICKVNGLCPNLVYNARVKAFNQAGCSDYSPIISMPASPSLWFSLNPKTSHSDVIFSNNYTSATCVSFEDRVALGSIGFSKGVHYWEITVDRYDNQPDPAFGVARFDVLKDHMLGKDNKSWCMYIDSKRSWFMHNGKHVNRIDKGVQQGYVVGVLLDLNSFTLSFYVNDELHGGTAFTKLPKGVYYPAFSLNKNVLITINSGLEAPSMQNNSDSD